MQVDPRRRQVDQLAGGVQRQVHRVLVAELLQLLRVVAADPARSSDADVLERGIHAVFVLQPVGHHVELQHAHRAEDQVVAHQRAEELGGAFLGQLRQALLQLLELERVTQTRAAEQFRREVGNAGERQRLAFGEGVADGDGAVVVDADHVARERLCGDLAVAGHEGQRVGQLHLLAAAHVEGLHAGLEAARAHPHEGHAVAVLRVHVGLDLEDEAGQLVLGRLHLATGGLARLRRRCVFDEKVQQWLHAEVVDARAEEHRRLPAVQVGLLVEGVAGALHQFQFVAQRGQHLRADLLLQARRVQRGEDGGILAGEVAARFVQVHFAGDQVHHALQALAHADRPGDRRALDAQHAFHFVQQLDRILAFAVQLVDEGHDGRVAQAADFHQLDGAFFHALGHVDHHQRAVHRGEHAVGVLAEVGVAGGVEQVDDAALVGELHHRGGDRDAALLLQRHPVRGGVAGGLAALDRAGHLDRAAEQQQLLGQRGLAGVGVGNDGEGAAARGFGSYV